MHTLGERLRPGLGRVVTAFGFTLYLVAPLINFHAAASDMRSKDVGRIVAVADIHGAYKPFELLLKRAELIDEQLAWSGGSTHFVVVGDVLDRGSGSRRVLELLMRLEGEARTSDGAVYLVLGNHEVMNLVGDMRYVSPGELAAYIPDEDPEAREQAFRRYALKAGEGKVENLEELRRTFDERYPPGYFGHRELFSGQGTFGKWLLKRPVILAIDGNVFAHAGVSQAIAGLGIETINQSARADLQGYVGAMDALIAGDVLNPENGFDEHPHIVRQFLSTEATAIPLEDPHQLAAAARQLLHFGDSPLFRGDSVIWYRGTVACSPVIARDRINLALSTLQANRLIVGHSPTPPTPSA